MTEQTQTLAIILWVGTTAVGFILGWWLATRG